MTTATAAATRAERLDRLPFTREHARLVTWGLPELRGRSLEQS